MYIVLYDVVMTDDDLNTGHHTIVALVLKTTHMVP